MEGTGQGAATCAESSPGNGAIRIALHIPLVLTARLVNESAPEGTQWTPPGNFTTGQEPGGGGCPQGGDPAPGKDGGEDTAPRFEEGSTVDFHGDSAVS